jgi:hypothetical protein
MKVGDLVSTKSKRIIGIILATEEGVETTLPRHHIHWSHPKVKKNPVWINERHLVRVT